MNTHTLKFINPHFEASFKGAKTAEIRIYDRKFKKGDYVILREFDPKNKVFLNRAIKGKITHVLRNFVALDSKYCMFSMFIIYTTTTYNEERENLHPKITM